MRKKTFIIFILILVLGAIVRIYKLSEILPPLHIDEAFMAQSAIAVLDGSKNILDIYFSTTVISNLLTAIFIKIFGVGPFILRLQSPIFGVLTNIFLYLLMRDLFNKRIALISFFIGSFSHLAIAYSRINLPNIQTPLLYVLSLYSLNYAIKQQKNWFFFLTGLVTGLSFYSYAGAKIIVGLVLLFLIINYQKLKVKFWLSFLVGLLVISGPIIIYMAQPNNNYLERESQVFITNNHRYWQDRWQTDNLLTVLVNQFKINFLSFFVNVDNSNQYGNGILLDKLSSFFFFIFFLILIPILVHFNNNKRREQIIGLLFFFTTFLIILVLTSLTESPPLSTRLIILYPIISLFISLTINYLTLFLKDNFVIKAYVTIILLAILLLNLKIYFYDYVKNKNAYYSWIEPNSSIGFYTQKLQDRDIYLLPNPHTYVDQPIISVLNYKKKKIKEIRENKDFLELLDNNSVVDIIIPLVPKNATDFNLPLKNLILEWSRRNNFEKNYYWGIPCKGCEVEPIFLVIKKLNL